MVYARGVGVICVHNWELYIADNTPYHFCKICEHTLYLGKIKGYKDCPKDCECRRVK